jgi:hypothetical protein
MRKWFYILIFILAITCNANAEKITFGAFGTGNFPVIIGSESGDHVLNAATGDESEWDSVSEPAGVTFDVDTTAKNKGTYGFEVDFDGTNIFAYGTYAFPQYSEIYVRFYYKATSTSILNDNDGDNIVLMDLKDGATTHLYVRLYDGSGAGIGILARGASPFMTGAFIEHADTNWHYVEVYYKGNDGATGGATVWVDGAQLFSTLNVDTTGVFPDTVLLGSIDVAGVTEVAPSNAAHFVYLDDLVIDSAAIGAHSEDYGIDLNGKDYINLQKLNIKNSGTANIFIDGNDNVLEKIQIENSPVGILMSGTSNTIKHSYIDAGADGISDSGGSNDIFSVILDSQTDDGILVTTAGSKFYNLTIYGQSGDGIELQADAEVKNTIFESITGSDINENGGSGTTATNYADSDGDPLFVNPVADYFALQPGSPAIDVGTNLGVPYNRDYIGRNQYNSGIGWEIGAYLYYRAIGFLNMGMGLNK